MRGGDKERLSVLRFIQAALKQKEVDERIELDNERIMSVLNKMVRQYRDSIEQFTQAGRDDLVKKEQFGLDVIESYLPKKLSGEEIAQMIENAISETGATSIKDMGKVMGLLSNELQNRADMKQVGALVKSRLTG